MLNRRTLRIKAMQSLYAWHRVRVSDYQVAEDHIRESFDPVLVAQDKDEAPDKALLKAQEKEAMELLKPALEDKEFAFSEEVTAHVKGAVIRARNVYKEQLVKDLKFLKGQMLLAADEIKHRYLLLVLLLVELGKQNQQDYTDRQEKARRQDQPATLPKLTFSQNKLLKRLAEHDDLQQQLAKYNLNWKDDLGEVRRWYREQLRDEEYYKTYQALESPSFEEDRQILLDITKHLVFKSEAIRTYMEDLDLNWEENAEVLRSMLRKTIKSVPEDEEEPFELIDLSPNWEEDRQFFEDLFDYTIEEDEFTDKVIAERAKNWEFDRIAATDKIILKMAVSEMLNFPSVPVKVTINEYIEISKQYSTPKSKQFVNGMLDVIAEHLTKEGTIRKSGRGLIDNK